MVLRWGIVSAGKISHDFVNTFHTYPDVGDQVITAVAARDRSRAEEFAKLHKIGKVFDNYQQLAESSDIDVVYIGALNPDHYAISKLFLDNGKHVLCEKPLCLNYNQAQSLLNYAKQKKLFLMEAVWSRFAPVYLAVEKEIQDGKLGEVRHVEVNFGIHEWAKVDRLRLKELGGSAMMDIGIYPVQFAQFVFKEEPIKISVIGNLNEHEVDIIDTVVLEYKGGRRAVLNVDTTVRLWNKATVVGTKGRMTVEDPFHFPEVLIHPDGTKEKIPLHTSDIPYFFENSAGLIFQTFEVEKCIREGLLESPRLPHKESLVLAKILETIRKQLGVHYNVDHEDFP